MRMVILAIALDQYSCKVQMTLFWVENSKFKPAFVNLASSNQKVTRFHGKMQVLHGLMHAMKNGRPCLFNPLFEVVR